MGRSGDIPGKTGNGPSVPEDAVGRVESLVVAQREDAGERQLTPLLPRGGSLVRDRCAVEPLDLRHGMRGTEGGRGIASGLEGGPAERLEVGDDRSLLAVGTAQRRAHLDEERRGLPVAPLQVGVGDGEGDARASRAHGAVERVELRRHPVGGEGDEGAGLLAHPVGQDRILANGRRERSLGEPQDADRLERESGGAGERSHVDGRLAEPDGGKAHRGDAILDDRECIGPAHAPGHLVGAGAVELVAQERMDRCASARVEDPFLQEVEEGRGEVGEGAIVDHEPGQRAEGGDGGLHRPEQVELVAEAPAVPLLLLGPESLERGGDLCLPGGKPLRPFERSFLASLVAAGGPDAPGDAHGLPGRHVLPVVHGGAEEGQHGGHAPRGEEATKRPDEGEGASPAGGGGEGDAPRDVDGEPAARPGEPLDAARDERRERVRNGDEDGHLLERRLPLEDFLGHPLDRGLHLGFHAGVLLEEDGAVRTLAARAGRVGEELRRGEEVADEEVALGGASGGERRALEGCAGVGAEEGLQPVEVAGTKGASGDDAEGDAGNRQQEASLGSRFTTRDGSEDGARGEPGSRCETGRCLAVGAGARPGATRGLLDTRPEKGHVAPRSRRDRESGGLEAGSLQVGDGGGEGFGPAGGGAEEVEREVREREVLLDERQEAGRAEGFLARGEGSARVLEDLPGQGGGADEAGAAQDGAPAGADELPAECMCLPLAPDDGGPDGQGARGGQRRHGGSVVREGLDDGPGGGHRDGESTRGTDTDGAEWTA